MTWTCAVSAPILNGRIIEEMTLKMGQERRIKRRKSIRARRIRRRVTRRKRRETKRKRRRRSEGLLALQTQVTPVTPLAIGNSMIRVSITGVLSISVRGPLTGMEDLKSSTILITKVANATS